VVRIHRAGEGAPYTGLKPAGLSEGPIIPIAEKAIEIGIACERLGNYDQATTEYQRALDLDDCLWPAYNSLGVLYLTERDSPDAALTLLPDGLKRTKQACGQRVYSPAEQLLAEGVSLATIRKRLGHKNLQTTLRYAEQSDATIDSTPYWQGVNSE
jgi:tetratricopeptide (TPR) repeat protein